MCRFLLVSNGVCSNTKESNRCCITVIASTILALGHRDFLKARRRTTATGVSSPGILKESGLNHYLQITDIVLASGSVPPTREQVQLFLPGIGGGNPL